MPIGGEKITHFVKHIAALSRKPRELTDGIKALRAVLRRTRWNDQGGYLGRDNGRWDLVSMSLSQVTPEELDALFALAGIEPDEIVSLGSCSDCANAKVASDGSRSSHGWYSKACISCKTPRMSNFVPIASLKKRAG